MLLLVEAEAEEPEAPPDDPDLVEEFEPLEPPADELPRLLELGPLTLVLLCE
jgi:hypothetical protein